MNNADSSSGLAWGLERIGIQACWQRGFTGAGVRVGHLDTGVDGCHPALNGRIAAFAEFDPDGFPVRQAEPKDSGWHGTHIAGIICGRPWEDTSIGVAPAAELCSATVIEGGKSLEELQAQILAAPVIRCDDVPWSLFGISLAGYNFLASIGLAALAALIAAGLLRNRRVAA